MDCSDGRADLLYLPVLQRPVLRIGFGCEALGGFNWGDVDVSLIEAAISQAIDGVPPDTGILFDTSDTYGPHLSEERLGRALMDAGPQHVIATKFGVRLSDGKAWYDTSPQWADEALDGSLSRLRRDKIDLYQLHWPDERTPIAKTLETLETFRQEGRINAYGVCNVPSDQLLPLVKDFPGLATFSLPFSLLSSRHSEAIQEVCRSGLAFLAYGCLAQGLLTGKYDETTRFEQNDRRSNQKYSEFHGERLARNLSAIKALKAESDALNRKPAVVALQFVLAELPGSIALAGVKSPAQWRTNSSALKDRLTDTTCFNLKSHFNEAPS